MSTDELARLEGVSFSFDGSPILSDVDLRVGRGEFVALVGPNGSGKSTLLRILLGLLPARGTVRLLGRVPNELRERWRIGYVPQRPMLAGDQVASVEEVVAAGRLARRGWWRRLRGEDRDVIGHALESVGLLPLRHRRVSHLSVGQQQRVFIARAFASEPELLVLDEPISGVDAESQRRFRESLLHTIEDHGTGVLLVSHELGAVAEDLDRVVVLKGRVLFDGPPSDLMARGVSLGVHPEDLPFWLEELR
ncbi:MAG TPA: metal ABC transporter ATP-binding protein [Actinomycetota bacterium]